MLLFELFPTSCLILILSFIVYYIYDSFLRCTVPGPTGVPILGYLPFIKASLHEEFFRLAKKFGNIVQVRMGKRRFVILSDRGIIEDAFTHTYSFSDRPDIPSLRAYMEVSPNNFAFRPRDYYKKRKAGSRALALFSTSRNTSLEKLTYQSLEDFFKEINANLGRPWNPKTAVVSLVAGIIGPAMFGFEYNPSNPALKSLNKLISAQSKFLGKSSTLDLLPFGELLMFKDKIKFQAIFRPIYEMVKNQTNIKVTHLTHHGPTRDVIQNLIRNFSVDGKIDADEVFGISENLFMAGVNTTIESIRWILNILACRPDIQEKARAEIRAILQDSRPSLGDMPSLVYLNAVILESFRYVTLVPLGIVHVATKDAHLGKWNIPQGTIVAANLWAIDHDPDVFVDPWSYKPERFITEFGSIDLNLSRKIMAFGVGKRRCIGENLAKQEIFITLASILQKYCINVTTEGAIESACALEGFTRSPMEYNLTFDLI